MKNNVDETLTKSYKTSDLALVSTLSLYYPIDSVDKDGSRRAWFSFRKSGKFDQLLKSYWQGELRIEPQQFFNQLKTIKTRIYSCQ